MPVSRSCFTTPLCPFRTAYSSGVNPFLSLVSGSTFPVSSSSLIIISCPSSAACDSAVRPWVSCISGCTSLRCRTISTKVVAPSLANFTK
ncbi:hypothetical protein COCHEDRAFT_1162723 [Bipolaris maydis C5]|uniref:Uncharacterized protein n=1 Tax=Cochliobolus heterostrophus (strain C5 / ATCC 48332 / race O) TaxID=701091 RepID=M2UT09_COCH5|nr:hypothetical protein COCHEDRAFT_1162723 [Bipolaris maydis C5]